jgi:hypothetical protein
MQEHHRKFLWDEGYGHAYQTMLDALARTIAN